VLWRAGVFLFAPWAPSQGSQGLANVAPENAADIGSFGWFVITIDEVRAYRGHIENWIRRRNDQSS
jgi:hypothetical protein